MKTAQSFESPLGERLVGPPHFTAPRRFGDRAVRTRPGATGTSRRRAGGLAEPTVRSIARPEPVPAGGGPLPSNLGESLLDGHELCAHPPHLECRARCDEKHGCPSGRLPPHARTRRRWQREAKADDPDLRTRRSRRASLRTRPVHDGPERRDSAGRERFSRLAGSQGFVPRAASRSKPGTGPRSQRRA